MNGGAPNMTSGPAPDFDITGSLPQGLTVLQASAGTGKTYAVAGLVARYVADGVPLESILVVTFTRAATGELRARVRDRLVTVEAAVSALLDTRGVSRVDDPTATDSDSIDPVTRMLCDGDEATLRERQRRLSQALADFDAATITTTHGFCEHVLTGLGVLGDVEGDVTLVEDTDDLINEVVDDLYVRRVLHNGYPGFSRRTAGAIAHAAMADPATLIADYPVPENSEWTLRRGLARGTRKHASLRKARFGVMTYYDLLSRLQQTLSDAERGPLACARLRERYRVVLIDEFQDTDPTQWAILQRAFVAEGCTLVLIGDPKQAIYNFRGADVYAYLAAAQAGANATLSTNWRTDKQLLSAVGLLFGNVQLGHPAIPYLDVAAAPGHQSRGIRGPSGRERGHGDAAPPPIRLRLVARSNDDVRLTRSGKVSKPSGEDYIAADLAADIAALLSSGTELVTRDQSGKAISASGIRPADLAVLVRTNRQATKVRDKLDAAGVPAVVSGSGSVFSTAVALDWLRLLEALERPAWTTRINTLALTCWVGWSAAELAGAAPERIEMLQADAHSWAALLEHRGVASLFEAVTRSQRIAPRLLALTGGERQLTDLRHISQLLHTEALASGAAATSLASWLRRRIADASSGADSTTEERSRRLESDAEAVQVLTVHRSKGLEFPIVYLPYLWTERSLSPDYPTYHDADDNNRRKVDVGGNQKCKNKEKTEELGEDLRLAYVALTRARHSMVLWWAASYNSGESPLGRLLFGRRDKAGKVPDSLPRVPTDAEARTVADQLAASSEGTIVIEESGAVRATVAPATAADGDALEVQRFDRVLDRRWRRTSYTAITAAAHSAPARGVGSEPGAGEVADEALPDGGRLDEDALGGEREGAAPDEPISLWDDIPSSARTGTLVHAILESVNFSSSELDADLAKVTQLEMDRHAITDIPGATLVRAVRAVIDTPLGPLADDIALRSVATTDRCNEMNFELPLAGGDTRTPADKGPSVADIAGVLRRHLPADDPMAGYADRLAAEGWTDELRGYLNGSVDLALRIHKPNQRFIVVDYKTNRLGGGPGAGAYHPSQLAVAMQRAHYPLQALLYSVALHRFLRWRLAGYEPERHLGGILYLFVRGMLGPDTPRAEDATPYGVFGWHPPAALVEQLSDLLQGSRA